MHTLTSHHVWRFPACSRNDMQGTSVTETTEFTYPLSHYLTAFLGTDVSSDIISYRGSKTDPRWTDEEPGIHRQFVHSAHESHLLPVRDVHYTLHRQIDSSGGLVAQR